MAQAGIIKTITGIVNARTPDGQIRQLMAGDMVYENEIIETSDGSEITIELSNGKTLALAENSQVVLDETVIAVVDAQDAVVVEAQALQAALEAGEDIPDEEPAAGEEDEAHDYDLAYYAGDQSRGDVGSYLFGTEYGGDDEDFPDVEGEEEDPLAEPAPLFIVGSNPGGESVDPDTDTSGNDFPYRDDVENPSENDSHTVNPAGNDIQGAILGQEGADILVGDPGGSQENLDNNYILVMDTSYSMGNPDGGLTSRLQDLQQAAWDMVQDFYEKVENSTDGSVKINLLPFSSDAGSPAWISFTKSGSTVVVDNSLDDGNPLTDDMGEIQNWINGLTVGGGTSYTDAFNAAIPLVDTTNYDYNDVIFISDGLPSEDEPHGTALGDLRTALGPENSIRVIGINMATGDPILTNIDPDAVNIDDAGALSGVISDLVSDIDLHSTGDDEIEGNAGNDLIFGDVLNTDGVFADIAGAHDLTGITEPPDGSGWKVFEILESDEVPTWTRADTLRYILENHEELAKETVFDEGGSNEERRDGGSDIIEGGDGDDIIYGQEGNDEIYAGAGNDTIDAGSGRYGVVDGGTGFDTLMVTNETELDFSIVSNIERIELNEDGPQNLTLSLNDVLSMVGDGNTLTVKGGVGDEVNFTDGNLDGTAQWTSTDNGDGSFTFTMVGAGTQPSVTIAPDNDIDNQINIDPVIDI